MRKRKRADLREGREAPRSLKVGRRGSPEAKVKNVDTGLKIEARGIEEFKGRKMEFWIQSEPCRHW